MTPRRILLTEDDPLIARDLQRRLASLGYLVPETASSGEDAIEYASRTRPDLVLMDIMLDGELDGIEAARIICEEADIPVIYLTASADNETLKRVRESEGANYILKPYREHELFVSIEMALKNHALRLKLREANAILESRVRERTADLEEAIQSLREKAALLDETQDAIMVRDLDNRVCYWNRAAERLYDWTAEEAIGRPIHELIMEGWSQHIPHACEVTLRDGQWAGEIDTFTRSKKLLKVQSRWTLIRDRAGEPKSFLIAHTDLTERKLLEEKFLRAQRLESVGALATGIAHDLNNVFTPILMAAQLLKEDVTAPSNASMLDVLHTSAKRGSDMVKQVLSFARGLEGGNGLIQLKHLLDELGRMMKETFPSDVRIEIQPLSALWPVPGDATQLYQVFMNLCINARDAMPVGGKIRITAENIELDESDRRFSKALKPGPHVCISVADNGTGMTPDVQKRIFEPFFTTKENGKGTGLGLSTVRTIVASHSGFIELESKAGFGTRFEIFLPADNHAQPAAEMSTAMPPNGNGELLLFVDDESATREVARATLEAHGYDVLLACDGTEAVAQYAANGGKIAAVITDMVMPFLGGGATIRALKRLNPSVKIIASSGAVEEAEMQELAHGESIPILKKPYYQRTLLAAIHDLLHSN